MPDKQETRLVKIHAELVDALSDFFTHLIDTPELSRRLLGTSALETLVSAYAHATCQDSAAFMAHLYDECSKSGGIPGKEASND